MHFQRGFIELCVDQEAIPKALKEVIDESLSAIKKTEPEYVSIRPVDECSEK
jgi:hypothetical protein